jgi:PAS domain S-box-containing protein
MGVTSNDTDLSCWGLSKDTLLKILENIKNEIYVIDKNFDIMFVSKTSIENYGLHPDEMIGKNHNDFVGKYWFPSVNSLVAKEKRRACIEQFSVTGKKFISTAVPVLDDQHDLKMIVSVVQEEPQYFDLTIDPEQTHALSSRANILTHSPEMLALLEKCNKASKCDAPILIQGPSGTGKSMLAKYIHQNSPRCNGPFLTINCASIPENLLESELFGYESHAFTGASAKGKKGLIELADNGTLFLDEVGELAISSQAKLLHAIENNQFIPVGGYKARQVNVRIISATNRDLQQLVEEKKFREDLFWRLNIIDFMLPPLASRKEDIHLLATYFLNIYNEKYGQNKAFSPEVTQIFLNYSWPGNIRQLKNVIERAFIISQKPEIVVSDLPSTLVVKSNIPLCQEVSDLKSQLEAYEKAYVLEMYAKYKSSRKMAEVMKISHSKANYLINKYCRSAEDH